MRPRRLPDGRLKIPVAFETEDGDMIDAMVTIGPDDPRFAAADAEIRRFEEAAKADPADEDPKP